MIRFQEISDGLKKSTPSYRRKATDGAEYTSLDYRGITLMGKRRVKASLEADLMMVGYLDDFS